MITERIYEFFGGFVFVVIQKKIPLDIILAMITDMTVAFAPFDYIEKAALRAAFYVGFGHKISSLM